MPSSTTAPAEAATPQTAMTTWERYEAHLPARDAEERGRYAEYDAARHEPEAGQ